MPNAAEHVLNLEFACARHSHAPFAHHRSDCDDDDDDDEHGGFDVCVNGGDGNIYGCVDCNDDVLTILVIMVITVIIVKNSE